MKGKTLTPSDMEGFYTKKKPIVSGTVMERKSSHHLKPELPNGIYAVTTTATYQQLVVNTDIAHTKNKKADEDLTNSKVHCHLRIRDIVTIYSSGGYVQFSQKDNTIDLLYKDIQDYLRKVALYNTSTMHGHTFEIDQEEVLLLDQLAGHLYVGATDGYFSQEVNPLYETLTNYDLLGEFTMDDTYKPGANSRREKRDSFKELLNKNMTQGTNYG